MDWLGAGLEGGAGAGRTCSYAAGGRAFQFQSLNLYKSFFKATFMFHICFKASEFIKIPRNFLQPVKMHTLGGDGGAGAAREGRLWASGRRRWGDG